MNIFVGITDSRWHEFLATRSFDEVNFWRPRSVLDFKTLEPGEPFLFKLHSPNNFIVGGGFFVRHTVIPISLAWKAFEEKNGVPDAITFTNRISEMGHRTEHDPIIGCTILAEPFFFPRNRWIPIPSDWASNIVQGKKYDSEQGAGITLWDQVEERLRAQSLVPSIVSDGPKYGSEYLARARIGQGSFRLLVTDAYHRRCAITGERTLPVLEASHIRPYSEQGLHRVQNGMLLRADLHILFDRGYITVTPDLHVEVSRRIREEYKNGHDYYALHGHKLTTIPETDPDRPAVELLRWHNEHRFVA